MLEARDGDSASYLDIGAVIEEVSPTAADDLRQLWRRVAFGILISNTDDHLRNHGFLHAGSQGWALSPAFDTPAFDLNPNPDPGPKYLRHGVPKRDRRALRGDDVERAANLYAEGRSAERVAVELRVAASTVRRALKDAGVTLRQKGRQPRSL